MDNEKQWILGYSSTLPSINVKEELKRHRKDPLEPLLNLIKTDDRNSIVFDYISAYKESYNHYFISLHRFLHENSIAVRWSNGAYYARKYRTKYTPSERKIADKYTAIARYLEVDFFNCLLYSRILMDKVTSLSRHFLGTLSPQPSYTSFNDHKRFMARNKENLINHKEYAYHISENTDWFNMPLKIIRDKYLVHAGPKHLRFFGFTENEFVLTILNAVEKESDKPTELPIVVSVPQLARDIEKFLKWFASYGIKTLNNNK